MKVVITKNIVEFNKVEATIHAALTRQRLYKGMGFAKPNLININTMQIAVPCGNFEAEIRALGYDVQEISPNNRDYFGEID